MAVISGAKFAYPNGIRLKYENVSLTLSVGDGAKVQTAPSGNASNTIVKAGKTTKLIFFMLCTSVYKFRFIKLLLFLLNHLKMLQYLHNCTFFIFWALWLPAIFIFR